MSVAIPVDPRLKTEDNTNGAIQVLVLGNRASTSNRGVRSIPSHIFDELRAYGFVYSNEPRPIKRHQRFSEVWK
jgi:hypothetical protein